MLKVKSNISDFVRQIGVLTAGPNSIYRVAGRQLHKAIWNEFETLLDETPQWTGSTTASWRIGFGRETDEVFLKLPDRTRAEALQRGSQEAISLARMASADFLTEDADLSKYARQDVVLTNGSPHFDRAEGGPLRPENTPPGALARFELRVANLDILVDFPKI